jgi:hypothetical protein
MDLSGEINKMLREYENADSIGREFECYEAEPFVGWPGDGSGTDDFADYNANEVDDYRNE